MSWLSNRKRTPSTSGALFVASEPLSRPNAESVESSLQVAQAYESAGRYGLAIRLLNEQVALHPDAVELWLARGSTYHSWSRYIDAFHAYGEAHQKFPADVNAMARLAWTCLAIGKMQEAEVLMKRVASLRPESPDSHYGLGTMHRALKQYELAIGGFKATIERDAEAAHAHINLGVSLMDLGRHAEAEPSFRRAIELQPSQPGNWVNLAVNLYNQKAAGAEEAYLRALELEQTSGNFVDAYVGYASYLRNMDRVAEAIAMYRKYLPDHPNTAASTQLGMCNLHVGEFETGWALYEFRWLQDPLISLRANLETPLWQGQDICGRRILVRAEQGVGDVIQFARYLRNVKALGATVLFQGRDGMEELSKRFFGVDEIVNTGERLPSFDYFTNLMSLPRFFGSDPASIAPCAPYIRENPPGIESFRRRLSTGKLSVGIVWAGNPTHKQDSVRSIPFAEIARIAAFKGVQVVSLQKGAAAGELSRLAEGMAITDWSPFLAHFGDTADAIGALDMVISVDTSVAHLAGALGVPTCVLLPRPAEWRWMGERNDTDWYPTARLIRQMTPGDWTTVIDELESVIESRLSGSSLQPFAAEPIARKPQAQDPAFTSSSFVTPRIPHALPSICEAREGIFEILQGDRQRQGLALSRYGEWYHDQSALMAGLLKLGQVVVQVGAGIGAHSVVVARLVGPSGHLLIYESDKISRQLLAENLRANRISNVTILRNQLRDGSRPDNDSDTESIDDLVLTRLDWIKIDDAEKVDATIAGATNSVWNLRPKIFANLDGDIDATVERMREFGYNCWSHDCAFAKTENFNRVAVASCDDKMRHAILAVPEEVVMDIELRNCIPLGIAR